MPPVLAGPEAGRNADRPLWDHRRWVSWSASCPAPGGRAAVTHYVDTYASLTTLPITPTSLVNFGEAVNFPLIFGVMLAVFGAATLAHLLVVSVARRRREIGLLKVLGFVNRPVASAVAWQATALALVGIIIGVPLGLAVGQAVWRAFASTSGSCPFGRAGLDRRRAGASASSSQPISSPSHPPWPRPGPDPDSCCANGDVGTLADLGLSDRTPEEPPGPGERQRSRQRRQKATGN